MNVENKQRLANFSIAAFVVAIGGAFAWDFFSPGSRARIVGLALFGALCILLRALGPNFLVPKQKKQAPIPDEL
jgi:membrane associated rhomboid family serine protease